MAEPTLPSQKFVEVKEIRDGVVYMKGGGMRKILIVNGVNFDLKSEDEQNLILASFSNFLNTLDFSVQFFVHSRKVNINAYLKRMGERKEKEENQLLKIQIEEYVEFIKSFVEQNAIISKTFFAIVPYESVSTGAVAEGIFGLFKSSGKNEKAEKEKNIQENLEQLEHRVDEVTSGLEQIGLRALPLNDEELTELFYNLYNPQLTDKTDLEIAK